VRVSKKARGPGTNHVSDKSKQDLFRLSKITTRVGIEWGEQTRNRFRRLKEHDKRQLVLNNVLGKTSMQERGTPDKDLNAVCWGKST